MFQIFGYIGLASASLLIVLRVYVLTPFLRPDLIYVSSLAIWDKNKIVAAIVTGLWVANVGTTIQGTPLLPPINDRSYLTNITSYQASCG